MGDAAYRQSASEVSVLFNEPKLLKSHRGRSRFAPPAVSVLFNEPKLLKYVVDLLRLAQHPHVSVLFNEPKLLKCQLFPYIGGKYTSFSALQRAEIAEMVRTDRADRGSARVSVLFNEPKLLKFDNPRFRCYSLPRVSVLFNEPKLLK